MDTFEYIISELKKFILEFPKTRVRYEHDNSSETHFIEVVPNDVYHLDTQYIKWESEMFDRFIELFPEQNICFISDDALVGLDKVDFEICGIEFISTYSTVNSQITVNLENCINVNSTVNNSLLFSINTCPDLLSSNPFESSQNLPTSIDRENIPSYNLPLAA